MTKSQTKSARRVRLWASVMCAPLAACAVESEAAPLAASAQQDLTISIGDLDRCLAPRFESTVADACAAPYQVANADLSSTQLLRADVHYGVTLASTNGSAPYAGTVRFAPSADGEYLLYLGSPGMEIQLVDQAGLAVEPVCGSHLPTVQPAGYSEQCSFRGAYAFNLRGGRTYRLSFGPSSNRYVRAQLVQRRAAPAHLGGGEPSCEDATLAGTLASACESAALTTPISAATPGSAAKTLEVGTAYGVRLREGGAGFEGALGFVPPYTADYLVYVGSPTAGVDVSEAGNVSEPVACAQKLDLASTSRIAGVSCPDLKAAFRYRRLEAGIPHQLELGPVAPASWVRTLVVPSAPDSDGDLLADNLDRCPSEPNPGTSCGCAVSVCAGGALWSTVVDTGGLRDTIDAVTVDAAGQIVTVGTVEEPATVTVIAVRKFDAAGNLLWQRTLSYSDDSSAFDVDTDAEGNIVVAGRYYRNGAFVYDALVAKLDPSGNLLWTDVLPNSGGAQRVALDAEGNVYAAATVALQFGAPHIHLRKLSPSGERLWGALHDSLGLVSVGDIALTSSGSPVVVGSSTLSVGTYFALVVRFDASGAPTRSTTLGTADTSRATGVVALANDGVLVARASVASNATGWLHRLDASDVTRSLTSYEVGYAQAPGLSRNADGDVVLASTVAARAGAFFKGISVRKFDAAGNSVWTQTYASDQSAQAGGAAFTADGSVIAVGTGSSTPSEGGENGLLLKYLP